MDAVNAKKTATARQLRPKEACMQPPVTRSQGARDPGYASAGVIPYNSKGFWMARMEKGWCDFGGKKEESDANNSWATARRECKEESGLDLQRSEAGTTPTSARCHVVYGAWTSIDPEPPAAERQKIRAVRLVTWTELREAGLPKPLHPRVKYAPGDCVTKLLHQLATRAAAGLSK